MCLAGCSSFNIVGDDCALSITNGTSATIWFLYVRDSATESWGTDLLEDARLEDSETYDTTVSPGSYDVQAEWPSPGSETFTRLDAATCTDGEDLGFTLSLSDQD